jgi:hypothetical protein
VNVEALAHWGLSRKKNDIWGFNISKQQSPLFDKT